MNVKLLNPTLEISATEISLGRLDKLRLLVGYEVEGIGYKVHGQRQKKLPG